MIGARCVPDNNVNLFLTVKKKKKKKSAARGYLRTILTVVCKCDVILN